MELLPAFPLRQADDPRALSDTVAPSDPQLRAPKRFDDILGQTLAGPLFATWTPTAPINPTGNTASTNSSVTSLDPNARRDGRKRSRR